MTPAPAKKPLVIAHRGASGYRPEHTRAAYELAIAQGADAIEPDIVVSSDGVLVLRHENEISGTTDVASRPEFAARRASKVIDGEKLTGWFTEDFTWAELSTLRTRERLPRVRPANTAFDGAEPMLRLVDLLAILDAADWPVALVAEIKHPEYFRSLGLPLEERFVAELEAAGWLGDERLLVECFELSSLARLRELGIHAPLVYLIMAKGIPADRLARDGVAAADFASDLTPQGLAAVGRIASGISVEKKLLLKTDAAGRVVADRRIVERAAAVGLTVFCWTLRPENRYLSRELRRGIAGSVGFGSGFGAWRIEFDALIGSGVDGVFADHPDLAISARSGR